MARFLLLLPLFLSCVSLAAQLHYAFVIGNSNYGCSDLGQFGFRPDDLVCIEGGKFQMGSNEDRADEKPIHSVTVPTFEICKYEVTNTQFCVFLNDIASEISIGSNGKEVSFKGNVIFDIFCGNKKGGCSGFTDNIEYNEYAGIFEVGTLFQPVSGYENHPVVMVSWYGAKAYCAWLCQKTGQTYRLPSEAEWEFAARGGENSKGYKYAGSNTPGDAAWYIDNPGSKNLPSHPVGQKTANELGLYDMSGNVWEWCADISHDNYSGAPTDGMAWTAGGNENHAVLRGGSWIINDGNCRVSARLRESCFQRRFLYGFRVAST